MEAAAHIMRCMGPTGVIMRDPLPTRPMSSRKVVGKAMSSLVITILHGQEMPVQGKLVSFAVHGQQQRAVMEAKARLTALAPITHWCEAISEDMKKCKALAADWGRAKWIAPKTPPSGR